MSADHGGERASSACWPAARSRYHVLQQFAAELDRAGGDYLMACGVEPRGGNRLLAEPCPLHGPSCARVTYGMLRAHVNWHRASVNRLAASLLWTLSPPSARPAVTPGAYSWPTVDRTGAAAGSVLHGVAPRNRGLRLRVLREQFGGDWGAVTGGVMVLEVGDNRHAADLAGLLHRVVDAPAILAALWRTHPGCVSVANKNVLAGEDAAEGASPV